MRLFIFKRIDRVRFKVISLRLIWQKSHIRSNRIFSVIRNYLACLIFVYLIVFLSLFKQPKQKFTRLLKHHNKQKKIKREKRKKKHKQEPILQDLAFLFLNQFKIKQAHQKRKKSKLEERINKRIRARLVRRLIWDEDFLCSSHNNPRNVKELFITKIRFFFDLSFYSDKCNRL